MSGLLGARRRSTVNIWPGFVDALAAMLIVVIFVILLFTASQFFLTDALTGKSQALDRLTERADALAQALAIEQSTTSQLRIDLSAREREILGLSQDISSLEALKAELESEVAALGARLSTTEMALGEQEELTDEAQAQILLLNRQLASLEDRLGQVLAALEAAEQNIELKDLEIAELGKRLNIALADKARRLAEYRSEFFGRLKEALGENPNLKIQGDRFVFQSELLFDSGSATLGPRGRAQVEELAQTLKQVIPQIPTDLDWVLRIDGHTDKRPISTPEFPSNWELSTARALAIVRYLVALGISPDRLAATGFGQHHPIAQGDSPQALAVNRRIELKLTAR